MVMFCQMCVRHLEIQCQKCLFLASCFFIFDTWYLSKEIKAGASTTTTFFFKKKKALSVSKGKIVKCEKPSTRNICLSFRDPFVKEEKSLKPDCRLFFAKEGKPFWLDIKDW